MPDTIEVVTSGKTVERSDTCQKCGAPMLYRVPDERIESTFCPNILGCSEALKEIPE